MKQVFNVLQKICWMYTSYILQTGSGIVIVLWLYTHCHNSSVVQAQDLILNFVSVCTRTVSDCHCAEISICRKLIPNSQENHRKWKHFTLRCLIRCHQIDDIFHLWIFLATYLSYLILTVITFFITSLGFARVCHVFGGHTFAPTGFVRREVFLPAKVSCVAGKYLVYHKWSLESGESNAISFVYWECDNRMLYEKMRKRYN